MYRRDAHNLACIFAISMLAIVFVNAFAALGDWLPNPTISVDSGDNAEQGIQDNSGPDISGLDIGFRPEEDGFSFENYADDYGPVDLTAVEMKRLFGNTVCSGDDECTLIPTARIWMEETNKEMQGGHCEGMAVLSLLFYWGLADPEKFGGATTHDLQIEENDLLQREIAYWWATQTTSPAQEDSVEGPNKVLKTLEKAYQDGENASDTWTAGVSMEDGSGAHAVTPFAVQDKGDGIYEILVYDNNYPDETKVITVDSNDDTFSYETSDDPDEESDLYTGHGLNLSGSNGRLVQQNCDFCQEDNGTDNSTDDGAPEKTSKSAKQRYAQVWHNGSAGMLIKDDQGRRLGRLGNGTFVNEIPGAKVHAFRIDKAKTMQKSAKGNRSEYLYLLPSKTNYSVSLEGAQLKKTEKQDVTSIGPGYYTQVEGLALSPASLGYVTFSTPKKGYEELSYLFDGNVSPSLKAGINTGIGPAYEFRVLEDRRNSSISKAGNESGKATLMGIDRRSNRLKVKSIGLEGRELYDLMVARLGKKGPEVFSHKGIALNAGAAMIVDYSSWEGEGHAMTITIDENDDGTVDETFDLANEGGIYGEITGEDNQMTEAEADEGDASGTESGSETGSDGGADAGGDAGDSGGDSGGD